MMACPPDLVSPFTGGECGNLHVHFLPPYILYKYITYLALKTTIVQNNIKHIYTIGLAAAAAAAAAA